MEQKVMRLTELDLTKIVKLVITKQEDGKYHKSTQFEIN
jgi:hypothetical protein